MEYTLRTGYAYTSDERGQRSKFVQSGDAFSDYGDVTSQQFAYNGWGELTAAIGVPRFRHDLVQQTAPRSPA